MKSMGQVCHNKLVCWPPPPPCLSPPLPTPHQAVPRCSDHPPTIICLLHPPEYSIHICMTSNTPSSSPLPISLFCHLGLLYCPHPLIYILYSCKYNICSYKWTFPTAFFIHKLISYQLTGTHSYSCIGTWNVSYIYGSNTNYIHEKGHNKN